MGGGKTTGDVRRVDSEGGGSFSTERRKKQRAPQALSCEEKEDVSRVPSVPVKREKGGAAKAAWLDSRFSGTGKKDVVPRVVPE